eukprot:scaffold3787_cov90-Skeletonema_marinoi.AAC.2
MSNVHRIDTNLTTLDVGRGRPSSSAGEEWESFKILFHDFADLPSAFDQYTLSPKFTCNGHRWCIKLYPGGTGEAREGYLSLYLQHCSGGNATAAFEVSVLDKFQRVKKTQKAKLLNFDDDTNSWGCDTTVKRNKILDQSENILDDNGTLAVIVSIKRDTTAPFVPNNPMSSMITGIFLDEKTADVCFEVSTEVDSDDGDGDDVAPFPVAFHAHRLILKTCAPMLASLFSSDGEHIATASITDVKPAIFRHLLHYVYGGSVPGKEMSAHAKDIINAADKYSIVNLKLEAEAAYVKSTDITMENVIDNLLNADALNLALLNEVVMDFLAENSTASQNLDFTNVPSYLMKDVFVAFGRKANRGAKRGRDDDLSVMSVSELRMKLSKVGLDVDGSRAAMIEAINANANEIAMNEDSESDSESDDDSDESSAGEGD